MKIAFLIIEVLGVIIITNGLTFQDSENKVTKLVLREIQELRDNQGKHSEELAAVNDRLHVTESELVQVKQSFKRVGHELDEANQRIKDVELELVDMKRQLQEKTYNGDQLPVKPTNDLLPTEPTGELLPDKPSDVLLPAELTGKLQPYKPSDVLLTDKPTDDLLPDKPSNDLDSKADHGDLLPYKTHDDLRAQEDNSKLPPDTNRVITLPDTYTDGRLPSTNHDNPITNIINGDKLLTKRQIPRSIAFSAALSVFSISLGADEAIVYDSVTSNIGTAYDSQTGMFKAPCNGVFLLFQSFLEDPGSVMAFEVVKNGKRVSRSYSDGSKNMFTMSSNLVIVQMVEGDRVWVRSEHQGSVHGESYTSFSGFLLYVL